MGIHQLDTEDRDTIRPGHELYPVHCLCVAALPYFTTLMDPLALPSLCAPPPDLHRMLPPGSNIPWHTQVFSGL